MRRDQQAKSGDRFPITEAIVNHRETVVQLQDEIIAHAKRLPDSERETAHAILTKSNETKQKTRHQMRGLRRLIFDVVLQRPVTFSAMALAPIVLMICFAGGGKPVTADDFRAEADSLAQNLKLKEALQVNSKGRIAHPNDLRLALQCAGFSEANGDYVEALGVLQAYREELDKNEDWKFVADCIEQRCNAKIAALEAENQK